MTELKKALENFKPSPKEFRERARKLKNKYSDELQEYRDSLLKEGKRFGHDTYSYNMITIQMFEAEKGVTYKDGEYFEYRMDYSPIIDGFSNGYGDYAGLNEGFVGYIFMQRTGLYDKNGVKIREGDIVKFRDPILLGRGGTFVGCVHFEEGCYKIKSDAFSVLLCHCFGGVICTDGTDNRTEVLGNIFENSDLLQ